MQPVLSLILEVDEVEGEISSCLGSVLEQTNPIFSSCMGERAITAMPVSQLQLEETESHAFPQQIPQEVSRGGGHSGRHGLRSSEQDQIL